MPRTPLPREAPNQLTGFGTSDNDYARAIAVDPAGVVYVTGTRGEPDPTKPARREGFLAKLTGLESVEWLPFGGNDSGASLITDREGNVFSLSTTSSEDTAQDMLLSKHDPDGELVWQKPIAGESCAIVDRRGNVFVAITTEPPEAPSSLAYLMRFDAEGDEVASEPLGTVAETGVPRALAFDAEGNLVLLGITGAKPMFELEHRSDDLFLFKFDRAPTALTPISKRTRCRR